MRQPRRAEDEREAEADEVQPGGPVPAVLQAGREEVPAVAAALGRRLQQRARVAVEAQQDQHGEGDGPPSSSTALTIWIQVVARIPPNET